MKNVLVLFFSLLLASATVVVARPSHDFHASIAEVKYNPQSRSFEVGVRYFTDDLAALLSKQEGKAVRIDKNPNTENLIARYTLQSFQLLGKSGNPMLSNYIGFENEGELTWVYMEIPASNFNIETLKVRYITLFDYFEDR